jgi:hypothetical protein
MKQRVCTNCGYVGEPIPQCATSFFVDAFIWLTVASVTLFTGFLPLLIIPLAWTTFHIVKYRTVKCPQCENLDMVSKESAKGKEALHHFENSTKAA